jgi:peptidoglycan biosynthesis protein MviN/MurJ (putative lipid II flippase)
VALAWIIGFPLALLPGIVIVKRILDISWSQYWVPYRPALTGCLCMAAAVAALRVVLPADWHHASRLSIQACAGATVYIAVMWVAFGERIRALYQTVRDTRA